MNILTQSKRRVIFQQYNAMKRNGADKGRLNRALGIAQRTQPRPYTTTADSCTCPDFTYRQNICKHVLAFRLANPVEVTPAHKSLAAVNDDLFG